MREPTEEDKLNAARALAGLTANSPVRKAIQTVLDDTAWTIADKLANESVIGDVNTKLSGQLGGIIMIQDAFHHFENLTVNEDGELEEGGGD